MTSGSVPDGAPDGGPGAGPQARGISAAELKMLLKYSPESDGMDDDIHKSKYRVGLELKKVAKRHPGRNYEIVCRYVDRLRMNNISMGRIANYAAGASKMLEICGAPVPEWTREDVENIHRYITSSDYSNIVKKDMLTGLKRLYHFAMHDELPNKAAGGRYDPMVDWIVPNKFTQRHRKVQAMDLLTEEELLGLVQAVKDSGRHVRRDVALIFMMLEGAYRPGEILSIKVGGVELHDGFAKVITTGKTGPKVLTLVSSQGPLREWLAEHPRNDDPEAYLFFHGNARGVMPYSTLVYTIRAAQKRAGIKKRIWPYLFRHTALTEYSKLMGNVAKVYGNWAASSNMISVYEHLASSDQEDAVLRLHGMRSERRRSPILFARECPSCAMVNSADREACARCGTSLEGAGHPMEGGAAGGRKGRGRAPARRAAPKAGAAPEPRDDVDARIKRLEEANARLQGMVGDLLARLGQ